MANEPTTPEQPGVWVLANLDGYPANMIPYATEIDALRNLNENWREYSSARVAFVPYGTDVKDVCQ